MALYKSGTNVRVGHGMAFESIHKPGATCPHSGIYRCENCGHEDACNRGDPMPPQNHYQHTSAAPIMWRCLVFAEGK